jgi:uncharacterized membrane protein
LKPREPVASHLHNLIARRLTMFGLSALGAVHTALALVAVISGFAMTFRFKGIGTDLSLGWTYVVCTTLACLTALGIFAHGGFGVPHALALMTLAVLAVCLVAGKHRETSRLAQYVETLGYTTTLLFHMVPATIEVTTRLPAGAPLFDGPDDPGLQRVLGFLLLAYLLGIAFQVRHIWRTPMTWRGTRLA